ncbi:MAG: hypothetical protein WCK63_18490 [Betaproteobacteria bacterium]
MRLQPALFATRSTLVAIPLLAWTIACGPVSTLPTGVVQPAVVAQMESLVHLQKGELPILISAPHGGRKDIPGSRHRTGQGMATGGAGFSTAWDAGTEELALELAAEVLRLTGKKPYLVVGSFKRNFLDCNRPPAIAYSDPAARAVYEVYHGALREDCKEIVTRFGSGLVVDLHRQGTSANTVYRGTKNGKSVTAMRAKFGDGIHEGPDSVLGRLKAQGWNVHPDPGGMEQTGYSGGFITQTYGSERSPTDAIQFEFGADYCRTPEQRKSTVKALAKVVVELAKSYHL